MNRTGRAVHAENAFAKDGQNHADQKLDHADDGQSVNACCFQRREHAAPSDLGRGFHSLPGHDGALADEADDLFQILVEVYRRAANLLEKTLLSAVGWKLRQDPVGIDKAEHLFADRAFTYDLKTRFPGGAARLQFDHDSDALAVEIIDGAKVKGKLFPAPYEGGEFGEGLFGSLKVQSALQFQQKTLGSVLPIDHKGAF